MSRKKREPSTVLRLPNLCAEHLSCTAQGIAERLLQAGSASEAWTVIEAAIERITAALDGRG